MSGYIQKDPESELELSVEWRQGYLQRGESVGEDFGWYVRPVAGCERDLQVVRQDLAGTRSRAVFSGGVPGVIYLVTSRIKTSAGRMLERSIVFRVAA